MQGGYFRTKRVHIFINGHSQSKAFNIHPRCRLGWNAILDCFSKTLRPNFGAIRVLRTIDGRKVLEGFNDLQHEGKYVACGLEPFRTVKGGYITSSESREKAKPSEYYPTESLSPDDQKKYPCLIETMRKGRIIIYVFANGKRADPKKVVLMKSDYEAWDCILKHIAIILDIPEGVKGMYTVFGQPLCSPYDIQHGGFYVAIPFNATFKPIKYLTRRNINSHHESSPMITKETYIAAAKTCTTIGGSSRIRRRSKTTKVKGASLEVNLQSGDEHKLEQHVKIEGTAIKRNEGKKTWETSFLKKRSTGHPGNFFFGAVPRMETPETLNQQCITVDSIYEGHRRTDKDTDIEVHENEIHITNYFQKEGFTQTSTIFFEATCDAHHALYLNQKKYFLVPEKELQKLGNVDTSGWCEELMHGSTGLFEIGRREDSKKEIEQLAGTMIGLIIKVSEKIANRTLYGQSETDNTENGDRLSVTPDKVQPKRKSDDLVRENSSFENGKERRHSLVSKDRSLRLSVPIGRAASAKYHVKSAEKSSSDLMDTTEIIHSLDREYKPLTPLHDLGTSAHDLYFETTEDDDLCDKTSSSLIKHLKKDSVGIPTVDQDSEIEQSDTTDEWKKLDILEDIGITSDDIGDTEDLERSENEKEDYGDDDTLSDDYIFSDEEETIESIGKSNSSYSNLHGISASEDEDPETHYCKKCQAQLKSEDDAEPKTVENVEIETYDEAEKINESSQTEGNENSKEPPKNIGPIENDMPSAECLSEDSQKIEHVEMKIASTSDENRSVLEEKVQGEPVPLQFSTGENNHSENITKEEFETLISNEMSEGRNIPEKDERSTFSEHDDAVGNKTPNEIATEKTPRKYPQKTPEKTTGDSACSEQVGTFEIAMQKLKFISEEDQKSGPLELIDEIDDGKLFIMDTASLQQSAGYELSSLFSQPVPEHNSKAAVHIEYIRPKSFVGSLEDRRTTVDTWDESVERILKNKFDNDLAVPKIVDPAVEHASGENEISGNQKIDNKNISSKSSTGENIEDDRRSLLNFLKMRIEVALSSNLPNLGDD